MTFEPGSSSRLRRFWRQKRPDRFDLIVIQVGTEYHVGEDLQGRFDVTTQGRGGQRGVQRLGALRMADPEVIEPPSAVRGCLDRPRHGVIQSAAIVAAPPPSSRPSAPSYATPAGRSIENAADWTPGIVSASNTNPLG